MSPRPLLAKFLPRLALTVLMLVALEFAFRYGIWDKLAKPGSYAGTTIMIKNAVEALGRNKVDFITIGDSVAGSGIQHEEVAARAQSHGLTHVHVGSGGMHWMSRDFMIRWVKEQSPRLNTAVIATNVGNFRFIGNGSYELGIAAPLARPWNSDWMLKAVEFDRNNLRTYGVYSALFQYRDDLRDLVVSPVQRVRDIRWTRKHALNDKIITHPYPIARNVCGVPLGSIESCATHVPRNADEQNLVNQCKAEVPQKKARLDYSTFADPKSLPHLAQVKAVRQQQLRDLPLQRPIQIVLMPVFKSYREEMLPQGIEAWTHAVLQPLAAEGVIEVHDFTRFLDGEPAAGKGCAAFHDLYHLNSTGQGWLTDQLTPIFESRLYRSPPRGAPDSSSK
jgi:hypothetical protein